MIELFLDEDVATLRFGVLGQVVLSLANISERIELFYSELLAGADTAVLLVDEETNFQLFVEPDSIGYRSLILKSDEHLAGAVTLRLPRSREVDAAAIECIARLAYYVRNSC